jgi:hypothetical protein
VTEETILAWYNAAMERREHEGERKENGVLETIEESILVLLTAARNPDQAQKEMFYRQIGGVILETLPDTVTDLRLTPDIIVQRYHERPTRKVWNMFTVESYAAHLAKQSGKEYTPKFTRKRKKS